MAVDGTLGRDDGIMQSALESLAAEVSHFRKKPLDQSAQARAANAISARLAVGEDIVAAIARVLELPPGAEIDRTFEVRARALAADAARRCFRAYDDVAPVLAWLAELNIPCAILTEGWSGTERAKAAAVGFGAAVLVAEDLETTAWSPRVFAALAETLMLPADRIWFVGSDLLRQIRPAYAASLHAVWLNRNHVPRADGFAPDATIDSLSQLPELLAEPYSRSLLEIRHMLRTTLNWRPGHFIASIPDSLIAPED